MAENAPVYLAITRRLALGVWCVHWTGDCDPFANSVPENLFEKFSSIPKSSPSTYHQRLKNQALMPETKFSAFDYTFGPK